MRIVIYGNFIVPYCSEVHHARSLEALGHEVIRLQETEVHTEVVQEEALKSDLLVWIHSHGFVNQGGPMDQVLKNLKGKTTSMAYHLDLYMPLPGRWQEYANSPYMNNLDYFFTVDPKMADWLNENTKTRGVYLPAGVLKDECIIYPSTGEIDVLFAGSRGYHEEWPYRPMLIDWLRETYPGFKLVGGDPDADIPVTRNLDLNRLYASAKVIVGDTLSPGFNYPGYYSDRLYETTGRGGFLIFPDIDGIYSQFTSDEIETYEFNNFAQLKEKIDYYLENDHEREVKRQAGYHRTKNEHTYYHRWQTILDTINAKN